MINDAIIVLVLRHVGATDLSQRTEVLTIVTFRYLPRGNMTGAC